MESSYVFPLAAFFAFCKLERGEKMDFMTPREYCASRHALPTGPFGTCRGIPGWRKVGRGLMAVTDGSAKQYVAPELVFGVEISDDGVPELCTYWRKSDDGMQKRLYDRPYALRTIRRLAAEQQMNKCDAIDYDELVRRVKSVHPNCWIPPLEMLGVEYGLAVADGKLL